MNNWSNLIVIGYAPGTRGRALHRIIELSPDAYLRNHRAVPGQRDGRGEMHGTETGFGNIVDQRIWDYDIIRCMQDLGQPYWPCEPLDPRAIDAFHEVVRQSWIGPPSYHDCMPFMAAIKEHKLVVSGHMSPWHARIIFPGCSTVTTIGAVSMAVRSYTDKHLTCPNIRSPQESYLQGQMRDMYGDVPHTRLQYKHKFRDILAQTKAYLAASANDLQSIKVDYRELFHPASAPHAYHDIMDKLGMRANWTAVRDFIDQYNLAQTGRMHHELA